MSNGDDEALNPGFFSLRSIHLSEFGEDAFVDPESSHAASDSPARSRPSSKPPPQILTTLWTWALSLILFGAFLSLPFVTLALFVPFANVFAFPLILFIAAAIFYSVPSLSYLSLAQIAAPPTASQPFLPSAQNYRLLFRVNLATFRWFRTAIELLVTVGPEIVKTKLLYAVGRNWEGRVKTNIRFASRPGALLDVYLPKPPVQASTLLIQSTEPSASNASNSITRASSPIIIFIPAPHYGLLRIQKWMLSSLGRNLARMGYCVILPDIVAFGDPASGRGALGGSRIRESVAELRGVMRWAYENGGTYGGDRDHIYLAGHGLGAHLALLHVIQRAVVASRETAFQSYASASQTASAGLGISTGTSQSRERPPPVVISNGTRRVHEYGKTIWVPRVEGLILLSPVCDVEKQVTKETESGIAHLSTVRRALGPGQLPCIMHSPAHILHASRNIMNIEHLPQRVLFLHGGFDPVVEWSQSEKMKELLYGVGVRNVKAKTYTTGHMGVLTGLMSHERGTMLGQHLENEVQRAAPL